MDRATEARIRAIVREELEVHAMKRAIAAKIAAAVKEAVQHRHRTRLT
jgi:hypothetical protein